jgi:hypothetical protein
VLYDSYGSLYGLYEASGRLQRGEICEKRGRCCILYLIKSADCVLEREVEVKMGEIMNLLLGDVFPFFFFSFLLCRLIIWAICMPIWTVYVSIDLAFSYFFPLR